MILFNPALRTNFSDGILLENYREKEVPKVPPHEADLKSLYEKTLIETIGKLHRNYTPIIELARVSIKGHYDLMCKELMLAG